MTKPILVVGGGPAGLAAAHALSTVGRASVLVEKAAILGGAPIQSGYAKLVPSGEWAKDAIGGMVSRVASDAARDAQAWHDGDALSRRAGQLRRGTLGWQPASKSARPMLATGFTHFDSVNKPEWGFGTFPDVVTTTQVEQMISSGQGVRCPSDGRKPKRVAILLCVGSRDRQIGREWCSKICCTVSANIAMEIREELPDCHVYIYYMDIRTYGLYESDYYWRSQEEFKVKYIKARIAEVTCDGKQVDRQGRGHAGEAADHDPLRHGRARDRHGPERRQHDDLRRVRRRTAQARLSSRARTPTASWARPRAPGVFVAGAAIGPETIDDSIAQAKAAALAALAAAQGRILSGGRMRSW